MNGLAQLLRRIADALAPQQDAQQDEAAPAVVPVVDETMYSPVEYSARVAYREGGQGLTNAQRKRYLMEILGRDVSSALQENASLCTYEQITDEDGNTILTATLSILPALEDINPED